MVWLTVGRVALTEESVDVERPPLLGAVERKVRAIPASQSRLVQRQLQIYIARRAATRRQPWQPVVPAVGDRLPRRRVLRPLANPVATATGLPPQSDAYAILGRKVTIG